MGRDRQADWAYLDHADGDPDSTDALVGIIQLQVCIPPQHLTISATGFVIVSSRWADVRTNPYQYRVHAIWKRAHGDRQACCPTGKQHPRSTPYAYY